MDEENNIPASTLRVVASLLALALDVARAKAQQLLGQFRPLVEPPGDVQLYSRNGTLYSGVVIVERGEVIAAIVVMVGQRPTQPPVVTPPPRSVYERPRSPFSGITDDFARRDGRLPGWADDPRVEPEEDEPWRHR